jgi:hypothetical protein
MRALKILAGLGLLVLLAGCSDSISIPLSLHPLCPEKEAIYDSALAGKWVAKGDEDELLLVIKKADDTGYLLTINTPKAPPQKFRAQFVRLGKFLFWDLSPEFQVSENNLYWSLHLLPSHSFSRVKIVKNTLQLNILDEDWLEKKILAKEITLAHEYLDDRIVLTAPTAELQAFVKKYGGDKEAFPDLFEFQRQK